MSYYLAKPLSKEKIRSYAMQVRKFLKLEPRDRINAAKLLDVLSELWKEYGFRYIVLMDKDPRFGTKEEATTDITTGVIYIKESVMKDACCHKYKRANFTICHEIGHFVLHRMLGGVNLTRLATTKKPKIYEDTEWQADTFASEFLMPAEAAKMMSSEEIRKTYCVSRRCTQVRYAKTHREVNYEDLIQMIEN